MRRRFPIETTLFCLAATSEFSTGLFSFCLLIRSNFAHLTLGLNRFERIDEPIHWVGSIGLVRSKTELAA